MSHATNDEHKKSHSLNYSICYHMTCNMINKYLLRLNVSFHFTLIHSYSLSTKDNNKQYVHLHT